MKSIPAISAPLRRPHPRAFLIMDVTFAIALALMLLMTMTAVIVKQRAAENRLATLRASNRNAEAIFLNLQTGSSVPAGAMDHERLPAESAMENACIVEKLTDSAPPGHTWVRLTLPRHDGKPAASLVGLVAASALDKGVRP